MSALATRIEREAGRPLTPIEIFKISASRETTLSRLLNVPVEQLTSVLSTLPMI